MPDKSRGAAPRIETERLILRAFEESDAPSVGFYADPDVMRYIPRGPWKREDVDTVFARMVARRRDEWRDAGYGMWAVVLKQTGALIGHCGLQRLDDGGEIEVFYLLDKPYWNQGIATEATRAALSFASSRGLKGVVAVAMPDNGASQRVMAKAGMTHVGRARHYGFELVKYVASAPTGSRAESAPDDGNSSA